MRISAGSGDPPHKLDALATGILEVSCNENREAEPMLEHAIKIDDEL